MNTFTPQTFTDNWLTSQGLRIQDLEQVLHGTPSNASFSDLYLQRSQNGSINYEESQLKSITNNLYMGCGTRVVCNELTGFAYCDSFHLPDIQAAFRAASGISKFATNHQPIVVPTNASLSQRICSQDNTPIYNPKDIVAICDSLDAKARAMPYITRVEFTLAWRDEDMLVLNTLGTCQADRRPLLRIGVRLVLEHQSKRESGSSGSGGRIIYTPTDLEDALGNCIDQAYQEAQINLDAKPCKAGAQTIVLGSGWPGVLLHEAVGHGLEGDFNRKKTSIYSDRINQQVTSPGCTIVDNGTMPSRRGSLNIDDEGNPTQENVLIENGKLCGYMQDMQNAMLMKQAVTGNGRRESYAHLPMPRMTNTYMLPGEYDPQEIIDTVDDGIYAVNFNGGQVDITSGNFVFNASLAYQIRNGKIRHPVKGISLIGNGPEVMQQIEMIGNDLQLDPGIGVCGKNGQSIPVGVGQPTLKVTSIVVGGQN